MARTGMDSAMAGVAASPNRTATPIDEETAETHAAIPAEDSPTDAAREFKIHTPGGTRSMELKLNEITAILVALQKSSMEITQKVQKLEAAMAPGADPWQAGPAASQSAPPQPPAVSGEAVVLAPGPSERDVAPAAASSEVLLRPPDRQDVLKLDTYDGDTDH